MIFAPHAYQRRAADWIVEHKRCALHVDMGLGKTSSTLLAICELLDSFDVRGVMVFAPLRVATIAWPEEVRKWSSFHHLRVVVVRGSAAERVRLLRSDADVHLLNYDLMPWWVEFVVGEVKAKRTLRQDMLVLDESSRLKSPTSARFKSLRTLADSKLFPRIVELTGTPAPESYLDLWSQYRLLDGGAALMPYITHFRNRWMQQNPYNEFDWTMRDGAHADIQSRIAPITFTARAEDYLELPPVVQNDVRVVLPPRAREIYKEFERHMLAQIGDETVAATSAAIVSEKCRQVVAGGVYNADGTVLPIHAAKFDALDDILEDIGRPILAVFWYKHEFATMKERYPTTPVLGPGVTEKEALRIVREWNSGKIPLLFAHPASVGHGLNLQAGGCDIVWLTIPWSNELYRQMIARLARQGQQRPVTVHRILATGTTDDLVDAAVSGKEMAQRGLRKALADIHNRSTTPP